MILKTCDLLCIGGGGAGVAAAVTASQKGANVIIASKEPIGYGNTRIVGGVMAYGDIDRENEGEDFLRDMIVGGEFLNNQALCKMLVQESRQATMILEGFGGMLGRDDEGKVTSKALMKMGGHTYPRTLLLPSTGPGLGQALRYAIAGENIETLEMTIVTDLIQDGNKVFGAVGYDLTRGEIVVINCRKTLLATGGGGWIYFPHTDVSRSVTGDGFTLALNAGAELIDMEQIQYIPFSLTHPPGLVGIVVGEPFSAGPAGILKNIKGEDILPGVSLKTRAEVANAIILETEKGNGTKHGGCLLDLKENKNHPGGKILYDQFTKGLFKNVTDIVRFAYGPKAASWDEPWDVYPSAHYFMGGIVADEWGRVKGVENLFACGEVCGGIHGGNRLGSVSLMEIFIFGKRAGECAVFEMDNIRKLDQDLINSYADKIMGMFGGKGKHRPIELKRKLQSAMWEFVGPARTEEKLEKGLNALFSIKDEARELNISSDKIYNTEFIDAVELELMIPVSICIAKSAYQRKESRGSHVRLDYPQRDDKNWLKNIVIKKDGRDGFVVEFRPVKLTELQPPS
jgi:succinate dehydrogenase/fumarate reductase flavoprotein subunit